MMAQSRQPNINEQLSELLIEARATVLRRWRQELRAAALFRSRAEFDADLAPLVDELARLTATRSAEAPAIFAELVGDRGARRYGERMRLRDAEREIGLLHQAIARVWAERRGALPRDFAALLAAIVGEGMVRVACDYARASEASDAKLRLQSLLPALAHLDEVVLLLDRRGDVAMAGGPLEALLGRSTAELTGSRALPHSAGAEALRTGRELSPTRQRVRNASSGEERICLVRAYPLREQGEVIGAVELMRDLTVEIEQEQELERADRELKALHAHVLRRVHGQAIADLAQSTALDINNELNNVSMTLQLARTAPQPSDELVRHLAAADAAVRRAAETLVRLQQMAARPNAPARAVALNTAVLQALDLVRPELAAPRTRAIHVDAKLGEVRPVQAQATELRDLLCTLIVAARQDLPEGGTLQIVTRGDEQSSAVVLSRPATGDPFATGGDGGEQALALQAARDRARGWGGDLIAERREGRSLLRLQLPNAPQPQRRAPLPSRPSPPASRRVLIVDDDEGNRETLTELLALSGQRVKSAESAAAALASLDAGERFDVALLDLAMPDMDGITLAQRLRAIDPSLRIAVVTGWEPSALEMPPGLVEAVFRKPIDLPAILELVGSERAADARSP